MKTKAEVLRLAGAQLYYEVYGSGPVLLMIPGGPADAGVFAGVAAILANRYTVVPYDPRGNSRSALDGPPQDQDMQDQDMNVHGDDAAHLLAALSDRPAYVMGSSGGAQIGLNLAARHPKRVHTLVAHEPPCLQLLPDAAKQLAFMDKVYDIYRREGVDAAMQAFMRDTGLNRGPESQAPPPPEFAEMMGRITGNFDFFLAHGIKPISRYLPDVAALRAGSPRVVVGVGETTGGEIAHRTGVALAERLGTAAVTFPGDHNGFGSHPAEFAERLHQVLDGK
jgi:pimeloyl-ACP methyl ester carboxylesterase